MQCPFTFGVEIFEAGHCTTPHSHASAHELFFILAGALLEADKTFALADAGRQSAVMSGTWRLPMRRCASTTQIIRVPW